MSGNNNDQDNKLLMTTTTAGVRNESEIHSEFNFHDEDEDSRRSPVQEIKKHKIFLSKNRPGNSSNSNVISRFNAAALIPGHNPVLNSLKPSKKPKPIIQQSRVLSNHNTNLTQALSCNANQNSNSSSFSNVTNIAQKKQRHDTYNKSIYIGTKNAEKWETLRTKLKCKNDVEFVTYLLNIVEKYGSLDKQPTTTNR